MAGYWPSSFFCMFIDQDEEKKNKAIYSGIFAEQAWSIKDLLSCFQRNFSGGVQQVVLNEQYSSILPARVANHSAQFWFILPAHRVGYIIK